MQGPFRCVRYEADDAGAPVFAKRAKGSSGLPLVAASIALSTSGCGDMFESLPGADSEQTSQEDSNAVEDFISAVKKTWSAPETPTCNDPSHDHSKRKAVRHELPSGEIVMGRLVLDKDR